MKFPAGYPDFGAADKTKLKKLGVTDAQMVELRLALSTVRVFADPNSYPERVDVTDILSEVEKLADALSKKLGSLALRPTAAHNAAYAMIEDGWWTNPERADDVGPDVPTNMIPRLRALVEAAHAAKKSLPPKRGRPRTADPRPIRRIDDALLSGWLKTQGSRVRSTRDNETLADMIAEAKANPPLPPYPDTFHPSKAVNSGFRQIVGICYKTVGGNNDPLRAIENYLTQKRELRRESMAAMEKGIAEATRKAKRKPATKRA